MSPRVGVDRAAVVQVAADLVNREGVDSLTLNRLAEILGIRTPSLYNHVAGLPGVYRELTLRNAQGLGAVINDAAIGKTGTQALEAIANAMRSYIKANPGLYLAGLRASRNFPEGDPSAAAFQRDLQTAEERAVAVIMTVLAGYGLEGDNALHAVRGLRSLVHGFTTLEIAGGFGLSLDCDESFRRLLHLFIHGLQNRTVTSEQAAHAIDR